VNNAKKTWALVVGIDAYTDPDVPDLQGAVADAVAFRDWLVALGVPKRQILQHAAPTDHSRAFLVGSRWLKVTPQTINDSVVRLEQVTDGARLIVYLAGHGLFEPQKGRLFLLPEFSASRNSPWNLGLDLYVKRFLAMQFPRQFLFMDGCQNLPYAPSVRQRIDPQMHAGAIGFTPRPGNLLVSAYAAAQGQLAKEIEGRGVFTKYLLEGLDLQNPSSKAVVLDFSSGERWLDLRKLVTGYVKPYVASAVKGQQTPNVHVEPTETDEACPFFTFRDPTPGKITVTVTPPAAVPAVELMTFAVRGRTLWSYSQPIEPAVQVDVPFELRVPLGQTVDAYCFLREGAHWNGTREGHSEVAANTSLKFELHDARGSTAPPSIEVRTVSSGGDVLANQFDYDDVARAAGFDEEIRGEAPATPDVRLEHHETGPVFRLEHVITAAAFAGLGILANRWGNAILDKTKPGVGIATVVTGALPGTVRPKLQVRFPKGGAPALAGQLAERDLLWIGPPENEPTEPLYESAVGAGPEGSRSLASLEKDPIVDIEPGHVLLRLDLPWGTWTETVTVSATASPTVTLPDSVGKPPLRVRLREELGRRGDTYLFGVGRPPDKPELRNGLWGASSSTFREAKPRSAQWAFMPPRVEWFDDSHAVGIATMGRFAFPLLPGRSLAAERVRGDLRVEPLAVVPSAAWDVLLFRGLLDDLPIERALELTAAKWKDAILGLAGAYAVYALPAEKRPSGVLEQVLDNLRLLGRRAGGRRMPDVDLLRAALTASGGDVSRTHLDGLKRWAEHGAVPVLRWGVALAIRLIEDDVLPKETFTRWLEALQGIEASLSPVSVWTVWRP
jgi:hypothetical protein